MEPVDESGGNGASLLERELQRLNLMLDASVDCIKVVDRDGILLKMNRSGCEALGIPVDETRFGMRWLDLLPPDVRQRGRAALRRARAGKKASFAGRSELPGRKTIYWDNILTPVPDADGEVAAILCLSRDVSRQREAERKLRAASEQDALTGLPNRRLFRQRAEQALRKARRLGGGMGLLMVDVDHFKDINDRFGHDAGDYVVKEVARRFMAVRTPDQLIARLGGDEFAVVIEAPAGESGLSLAASRLAGALNKPFAYNGNAMNLSVSIGGAMLSGATECLSDIMKAADLALYGVKLAGRNGFLIHRPH